MVNGVRWVRSIGLALAVIATLTGTIGLSTISGAATTSSPGITSSTITLGQIADISGPVPGLMEGTVYGTSAWAAYVNSTGGIDGRKIVLKHSDSGLNCNTYTNEIQADAATDFALVGSASAADSCGEATLAANPNFPDIVAFFVAQNYGQLPNVYNDSPQPVGSQNTVYLWTKQKYGASVAQHFASLYASSTATEHQANYKAAQTAGYKLVYSRAVGYSESNFTADILRMKSEGIEVVDAQSLTIPQTADFLNQSAQQNFHPKAVFSFAYDPSLLKLISNPSYANNVVMPLPWAMFLGTDSAAVPAIKTMTKWVEKTNPGAPLSIYVEESWLAGLFFQQAMKAAGPNPTQQDLLAAIKKINNFTGDGMVAPQQTGKKIASPCAIMAGVKNGKFIRIAPKSGFDCSGKFIPYNPS